MKITWQANQTGELPGYKGGLLRGALGYALRKRYCRQDFNNPCKKCNGRSLCQYALFFEPVVTDVSGGEFLHGEGFADSARPFIIDTQDYRRHFQTGDSFRFSLRLLGMKASILEVMKDVFADIGDAGLGKFRITGVFSLKETAFSSALDIPDSLRPSLLDHGNSSCRAVTLNFQTWTVLKSNGEILHQFEKDVFAKAVLRRIRQLVALYGERHEYQQFMEHYDQFLAAWRNVKVEYDHTEFKKWGRTSTRQKQTYEVEGFTGNVRLLHVPLAWLPLLEWSQLLHVGKGATFGLGSMSIQS